MQTFLDDVAKIITASHDELNRVKIIVPSIRSISFLKEALKKQINSPKIAPEIDSIESFIKDLSGLERIPKVELYFKFREVYIKNTPKKKQDSLNQFFNWAPSLIQEFNEIDSQLVNPDFLFDFMGAIGKIEQWNPKSIENTTNRYSDFQKEIPKLYKLLYKHLLNQQQGYAGMQLREAVRNLTFYTETELPFHYFVGFNALTKAEEAIIQELLATDKAEILWDIDQQFFSDPFHGAGYFIRQYYKNWNALKSEKKNTFPELFASEKHIEIINIAKNTTQAKTAVHLATDLYQENPNQSTVVVLGDESLLQPTLSSLSGKDLPWNITMGYPLRSSSFSAFFSTFFEIFHQERESGYPLSRVKELMQIEFIDSILEQNGKKIKTILKDYEKSNCLFIPNKFLTQVSEVAGIIFSPFKTVPLFLDRMQKLMVIINEYYLVNNEESIQLNYSECFKSFWEEISILQRTRPYMLSLKDVEMVFDILLEKETLDFYGDSQSNLQIMGLLETRLLDFDNVIITNLNEGIIPFGKTPVSSIPFDVRKKFGMTTFIEQDHLYAYHFFRLLQRSKKIFLLYNSSAEGMFSGEKSRFLVQLEYFKSLKHELIFKQVELPLKNEIISIQKGSKTKAVLEQLDEMAKEGFSPSSLTQYIRNPYLFYEQRMLKVKPLDSLESEISAIDKGTIMHKVLEVLYLPFLNKELLVDDFDQILEKLPKTLKINFNKISKNNDFITGKNFIIYSVMHRILKSFIIEEKESVLQGDILIIKALEHEFSSPVWIESLQKKIVFKGTVDRIDSLNGVLRFVDYKTGNVTANDLVFSDWSEVSYDPKKSAIFQVLLYSYILQEDFLHHDCIAGVIPLKNFKNTFLEVSKREGYNSKATIKINLDIYKAFEKELFSIIEEIYDPNTPFIFKK